MIAEILIFLLFLILFIVQVYRIKQIIVREKKSRVIVVVVSFISLIIILGITVWFGQNSFHYLIGTMGAGVLLLSIHISGITKNGLIYYGGAGRGSMAGHKVKFEKVKKLRIEEDSRETIKVEFVVHTARNTMKFSKDNLTEVKKLIGPYL